MRKYMLTLTLLLALLLLPPAPAEADTDTGTALVYPYATYSYEQLCTDIAELQQAYPELISWFSLGYSADGREIPGFTLGRGERRAIICAATHGREHITTNFIMYMTEGYCRGYAADSSYGGMSYREALDNVTFVIVPMVNPDGVSLAQYGLASVSPARRAYVSSLGIVEDMECGWAAWKANINGVDINRNFTWKWGLNEGPENPCSAYFSGPAPVSEPESQAMTRLLHTTDYYMLTSLHTMGQVIYWLDTDTLELYDQYYPIADRFAQAFGYELLGPEDTSQSGGYMVNEARYETKRFCMTVEMYPYMDYAPFPPQLFGPDAARVYDLGLIMADEIMKLPAHAVAEEGAAQSEPPWLPGQRPGGSVFPTGLRPLAGR